MTNEEIEIYFDQYSSIHFETAYTDSDISFDEKLEKCFARCRQNQFVQLELSFSD